MPGAVVAVGVGVLLVGVALWRPRWGMVGALLGTVALHGLLVWNHVDDAGIVYAYAENLAAGRGLVPQPGVPPVEGISDPLWLLVLTCARLLGVVPTLASKGLQLGLSLVAVLGAGAVAQRTCPGDRGAALTMAITASSGAWVAWSTAGLEGALLGALLVLTAWAAIARPAVWLVALVVACTWTRPEGWVAGVMAAAAGSVVAGTPRKAAWAALGVAIGLGSLHGLRLGWLGTWLPNSAAAKLTASWSTPARGAAYAGLAVLQVGWVFLFAAAAPRLSGRRWVPAALVIGVSVALAVASGGDWMRHARFLAPYVPLAAGLLVPVAASVAGDQGASRWVGRLGLTGLVVTGLFVLGHAVWAPTVPLDHGLRRGALYASLGAECGSSVATPDVGGVIYAWPEVHVVDLAGLIDAPGARRGREPGFWSSRLRAQPVAVVDLHGRWAERTGLDDAVLQGLGYRQLCRRGPTPEAPTLWLDAACPDPDSAARGLLAAWCEGGSGVAWPGESRRLFP